MPERQQDSLDRDVTAAGDLSRAEQNDSVSLGDQSTAGDAGLSVSDLTGDDETLDEIGEVVDLSSRYEIQGELGAGGMGQVLKAVDRRLKRTVAIKRLKAEISRSRTALRRFLTEAQAVAALNHFHIVQVHDYGRDQEGPFLILEFVDGTNLAERLQQGPIDVKQAVEITGQLCDALSLAHQKGIIHRDIKPANILLTRDEIPKLTDFGLARQDDTDTSQTQTGAVIGTLDYMPPEQRRDATSTDNRSDLWSLGATLYQMLSGELPRVIDLDLVPTVLRDIVAKVLKSDPAERYAAAAEFSEALRSVVRSLNHASRTLGEGECRECGVANDTSRKFCRDCGAGLREPCLECSADIGMWEKFCPDCGTNLEDLEQTYADQISEERQRVEVLRAANQHHEAMAAIDALIESDSHSRIASHLSWAEPAKQAIASELQKLEERTEQLLADARQHREDGHQSKALACLQQISESFHTPDSRELLDSLRQEVADIESLREEIQQQLKSKKYTGLLTKVDEYLAVRPNNNQLLRIRSKLQSWEQRRRKKDSQKGADIPEAATGQVESPRPGFRNGVAVIVLVAIVGAVVLFIYDRGRHSFADSVLTDTSVAEDSTVKNSAEKVSEDSTLPEVSNEGNHSNAVALDMPQATVVSAKELTRQVSSADQRRETSARSSQQLERVRTFEKHGRHVLCVDFSPNGRRIASGGQDKTVRVWNTDTGQQMWRWKGFTEWVLSVRFSPDGKQVFACAKNLCVILDATTGQPNESFETAHSNVMALSEDCTLLAAIQSDQKGTVSEIKSRRVIHEIKSPSVVSGAAFSPDNSDLIFGWSRLHRLNLANRAFIPVYVKNEDQGSYIIGLQYSPEGSLLATGSHKRWTQHRGTIMGDCMVRIWNARTGHLVRELPGHREWINAVSFTPDGTRLLSAGGGNPDDWGGFGSTCDRSIRLWEVSSGRALHTFRGHDGAVMSLDVAPDSQYAVSGSCDGTLILWRL